MKKSRLLVAPVLLYQLGLRDGDHLTSLNGIKIENYIDLTDPYHDLWLNKGKIKFHLKLVREDDPITLHYTLE